MLQITLQNDTLLKQLHQAVESESLGAINLSRRLIEVDTIITVKRVKKQADSLTIQNKTDDFTGKAGLRQQAVGQHLDSLVPISPHKVELSSEIQPSGLILPEKEIQQEKPDWVVGIFILALILLATVRLFFDKYLNQLFQAVANYATSLRLFRERTVSLTHASFRLDLIFYFIFSVFIFQLLDHYHVSFHQPAFVTYLIILGLVVGYFLSKRLAYFFTAIVSESTSETAEFLYNINVHNRILGLFLIPVTLVIAFSSIQNTQIIILSGLFVCASFYILLLIRGARILMTKHFSIFYLILYLCTLEILPLIFIYKMVLV
jgi:hypothetical protein